jgi:hypothetical protein
LLAAIQNKDGAVSRRREHHEVAPWSAKGENDESDRLGEIDTTFHDASASLGHDIEIHVDGQGLRDFFQIVREGGEGWDGSEPLRPAAT